MLKESIKAEKSYSVDHRKNIQLLQNESYKLSVKNNLLDKNTLDAGQQANKLKLEVIEMEEQFEAYRNGLEILDKRIQEEKEIVERIQKDNRTLKLDLNDLNKEKDILRDQNKIGVRHLQKTFMNYEECENQRQNFVAAIESNIRSYGQGKKH